MSETAKHVDKYVDESRLQALLEYVLEHKGDSVIEAYIQNKDAVVICRKQDIVEMLRFLRNDRNCQFKILCDVTAVDYLEYKGSEEKHSERFDVVYNLLSVSQNIRIRVKAPVADGDGIRTVTNIFSGADWYERETYDMFGIVFEGHPDLRRILTDYGFEGFPLRKDFPLNGHVEVYYDSDEGRVKYKPVDMPQEFREFDKQSPWKGDGNPFARADEDNVFDGDDFK